MTFGICGHIDLWAFDLFSLEVAWPVDGGWEDSMAELM
jgi:hypothetical protein